MTPLSVAWPAPGRYLLAISGGADSMTLLDLFVRAAPERGYELVVAHFDHGLRADSAADAQFVVAAAQQHGLPHATHAAQLGQASEAAARTARYRWLEATRRERQAHAIITAHHQDDLIETSLLNLARGSGRRGLAPMRSGAITRPLLALGRQQLRDYAAAHHLAWREDPTNADLTNPRNYLRHQLLATASPAWRQQYLHQIASLTEHNRRIDRQLSRLLEPHRQDHQYVLPRQLIRDLSLTELTELILAACYALQPAIELDRRLLAELTLFTKTGRPHRRRPIRGPLGLAITPAAVIITSGQ